MQPTSTVRTDMPENAGAFTNDFFRRFTLRPRALELEDGIRKTYQFPTLYADVGCAIGIFFCDYDAAQALMPHPAIVPVRMPLGRSLVIFSCYEYRQVHLVWPYNEIAMTLPVMANARFRPPVVPMILSSLFPRFGYHVFHMPVTSRENQLRGNRLWGLPKVTERVDIEKQGSDCVTTAFGPDGTPYFTLRVPTEGGKQTRFDVSGHLYSRLDAQIFKSPTWFQGEFSVIKHPRGLWKRGITPEREYLKLGAGPAVEKLRQLKIEPEPFQLRFTPSMSAAFGLPLDDFQIEK
jgi:hypothetical protein